MKEKAIKIKRKRSAGDWFLDVSKVVFGICYGHLRLSFLEHLYCIHQ